jgi:hypothetical protein
MVRQPSSLLYYPSLIKIDPTLIFGTVAREFRYIQRQLRGTKITDGIYSIGNLVPFSLISILHFFFFFPFAFTFIICLHYIVYEHLGKKGKRKIRDF